MVSLDLLVGESKKRETVKIVLRSEKNMSEQQNTKAIRVGRLSLFLLAIFLTACGAQSPEIQSIESVTVSGPPQIVDITDAHATLLFESSIPLACSVVYGETTEYGLIAVDSDMAGGSHSDHHPLMTGLKPDTEYHYRVQGTAADGTLYRSEDMTFRTPPADEGAPLNLAALDQGARVIEVSSNFGGAANDERWGANSAIDGNPGTEWSSSGDGDEAFIEIELAGRANVSAVEVWTRAMTDGTAEIFSFTLTTDGGEVLGPFELTDSNQAYSFEMAVKAETIRLDVVESSGGNTGLVEFAVYGELVGE
jgi:hypothetical protein